MFVTEIMIAILLGLLIVVTSIYLTYFSHINYQKIKNNEENEETPKKKIALPIALSIYLVFSLFIFITKVSYSLSPTLGNQIHVSVNSTSMAAKNSANTYLKENKLNSQIAQYDVAVFDKYDQQEIKLYDIILFKQDNKLIVHRIVEISEDQKYYTQGDNNKQRDDWTINDDQILGIYNHSLVFLSFVNYLGYTPGFYIAMVGVMYDLGVLLVYDIKKSQLNKELIKKDME